MGITLAFHPRTHLGLQGLWIGKSIDSLFERQTLTIHVGQVVALFIVGLGEYAAVWLGTDWEKEVKKGVERNREEAKRRLAHGTHETGLQH